MTYNIETALLQLKACGYECDAGSLEGNTAFKFLSNNYQKFFVGQKVFFLVEGTLAGHKISKWQGYTICNCRLSANNYHQTYVYDLTADPTQPYHYGSPPIFTNIEEDKLFIEKPSEQ